MQVIHSFPSCAPDYCISNESVNFGLISRITYMILDTRLLKLNVYKVEYISVVSGYES